MKRISAQSKLLTCVIGLFFFCLHGRAQCEADHTIVMADYYFAPSELTILPGETVAFVNVQGTHDVNGITNTLTGESWSNPSEFYLEQAEGTEEGTCMGVVTFDIPGVYNFDSSIGFQAQLGMVGTITVDAFTLLDLMLTLNNCLRIHLRHAIRLPELRGGPHWNRGVHRVPSKWRRHRCTR